MVKIDTMRRRGRILLCCLVILLFASSARGDGGAPSGGNVFLWTVRSEKGAAYLLGSIHLLKKEMYPLDRRIEEAFAGSNALAVETDIGAREKEKLGSSSWKTPCTRRAIRSRSTSPGRPTTSYGGSFTPWGWPGWTG